MEFQQQVVNSTEATVHAAFMLQPAKSYLNYESWQNEKVQPSDPLGHLLLLLNME